jgi:hypothetical protein
MKVNEFLSNLDVEAPVWLDSYFRPFSNVISIKTSRAARKNTSNMAATDSFQPWKKSGMTMLSDLWQLGIRIFTSFSYQLRISEILTKVVK